MHRLVAAFVLACLPLEAAAVQPDEMLDDPALEERAREISEGLRCLVCRNESIDESNAPLAGDLRVLVRERLLEGDSNEEVVDFVVDRYGEYVLLNPRATGSNLLLWLAGPAMFLVAAGVGYGYVRARRRSDGGSADLLSDDEAERLKQILRE